MWADQGSAVCLLVLALWILVSGLDDLFIAAALLARRRQPFPWPTDAELDEAAERRIAVLVPLWQEHGVIGRMLDHNTSVIRYANYDIFVGVYPNDELTERAVVEAARANPRVHLAVCPHPGPTSKGDCLNWICRSMRDYELRHTTRFDVVVTHDAEDLIHPEALRLINWFSRECAMVQVPVLPLPTPGREFTHGVYCDEFAEYQSKDIPARQQLGGFLPSNGVGTGFGREALDALAASRGGQAFDPECLTEDYENGYRLYAMGYRQIFLPVRFDAAGPVATREYFPRGLRPAIRQRTRWVTGIALQGWERHGWRTCWRQRYWFWRDRKGLVGNLLSPAANALLVYAATRWWAGRVDLLARLPAALRWLYAAVTALSAAQVAARAWCCARVYGWRMAALVPLRLLWANQLNGIATVAALWQYARARLHCGRLAWRKTEHVYPIHRAAGHGRPKLGDVLVRMGWLSREDVEEAARMMPRGLRLGEYLVHARKLSEQRLYEALSVHTGLPFGRPAAREVDRRATRTLPARAARRWKALPYRVAMGQLHVLTSEAPGEEMTAQIARFTGLAIRFRLARPRDLEELSAAYLGRAV